MKFKLGEPPGKRGLSPPAWVAWIEMYWPRMPSALVKVATRMGGVD